MRIQDLFFNGLHRGIPELKTPPLGYELNLGPGDIKRIKLSHHLNELYNIGGGKLSDDPSWVAPEPLPFADESVGAIHCYQFIEHFDWHETVLMLQDWERVLKPGGVVNIATPHQISSMSYQALDHKTHWNEEVWDWLLCNEYYNPADRPWRLYVHTCFIMGVVIRNLNLFTQLVKD